MNTLNEPPVAVIVLNHNVNKNTNLREIVKGLIRDLHTTDYMNCIFLLLDNGSTDGTYMFLKRVINEMALKDLRFILIRTGRNLGYSGGNILGYAYLTKILKIKPKYIIFLNNDVRVFDNRWLRKIVDFLTVEENTLQTKIIAAQPKIVLISKSNLLNGIGFINALGFDSSLGDLEFDQGQYDSLKYIFYTGGSALITTSEAFEKVGMFDPKYFLQMEEVDFCWRIWLAGGFVLFIPRVVIGHESGMTIGTIGSPFKVFLQERNRIATLFKNYSAFNLIKYLPILFFMEILQALLLFIYKKNLKSAGAIILAIPSFIVDIKYFAKKRMFVQYVLRKRKDEQIIMLMRPISVRRLILKFKRHR